MYLDNIIEYKIIKMYKVEIKNLASEVYNTDIQTILEIVSTFAKLEDIISITKV